MAWRQRYEANRDTKEWAIKMKMLEPISCVELASTRTGRL